MLKWKGIAFKDGIPARDLSAEEVEKYGGEEYLLSTGLYEKPKKVKRKPTIKSGGK